MATPQIVINIPVYCTICVSEKSEVNAMSTVAWKMHQTNTLPRDELNSQVSSTLPVAKLNSQPTTPATSMPV